MVCETLEEVLNPNQCAVLSIDMQNDFMMKGGAIANAGNDVSAMTSLIPKCAAFLTAARQFKVPIIHVRMIDLPEGKSDSPSWLRTKTLISSVSEMTVQGTWGAEFVPGCGPEDGEPVVDKHRSSGFTGTNLVQLLNARRAQTVIVVGEQTPGCVEATFRDAAYHDFYNVLVEDCVAAHRQDLHEASLALQRARHDVTTAAETIRIWEDYRSGRLA